MQQSNGNILNYYGAAPTTAGRCLDCYAPLAGVDDDRCPDCGRKFDPTRRATMHMGPVPGNLGRFLLHPVGRPTNMAAAVAALIALVGHTAPRDYHRLVVVAGAIAIVLTVHWVLRFIAGWLASMRFGRAAVTWTAHWRKGIVAPIIAGATLLLIQARIAPNMALWISRPGMQRLAERTLSSATAPDVRWVGVFPIDSIEKISGGMRFRVRGAGAHDATAGFAYLPTGKMPDDYTDKYRHISGPWYSWKERTSGS